MGLSNKSMFLYGFEVNQLNACLDFQSASGGPVLLATLQFGFYSLTSLGQEIARAMKEVDPTSTYAVSVDRTVMGGLQNRVTISTSGSYLKLLFGSGPRSYSSIATYIGFNTIDYSGALFYTGSYSAGTTLIPDHWGYNYLAETDQHKLYGAVNIAANGDKEAITFQIQKMIQVQFKFEPNSKKSTVWVPLIDWMIQQRLFEFTPEISSPTVFSEVTLEKTAADGKGLAWKWTEQLPQYRGLYDTGLLTFRVRPSSTAFI
jgi:hypothetical protein